MAYTGSQIPIPFGELGLRTDEATTSLPPNALIKANNISMVSGRIEKSRGTEKYNPTAIPAGSDGIVAVFDWWPTSTLQRLIAVTANGDIYRDTGDRTFTGNAPIFSSSSGFFPTTHMVSGGQEAAGNSKVLFIFTGIAQVRTITGDAATTATISSPSPDWSAANFPTFGCIYANRLCVSGSAADPHRLYLSTTANHKDFTTGSPPTLSIFPGEGDGIICTAVFRGLLFVFKKPLGVYIVDGRDPDPANWTVSRYSDSFGVSSPHAVLQILNDLTAANSFGSYTSLQASDQFGDFEAGDILSNNLIEDYIRSIFNNANLNYTSSVYYPEKKTAYFTGQSSSNTISPETDQRDQMVCFDVARPQLRATIDTKERPNCLALRRDSQLIQRPMYGAKDGFVWLMDQPTYSRDGSPYLGEFQTAYTDFSFSSSELAGKNKIFDFLEVNYITTGNNSFFCDIFIDGKFIQTLEFAQFLGAVLDDFVLDVDTLSKEPVSGRNRKPLKSCVGNKISFRFYNNSVNESFKIERIVVSLRVSDEKIYGFQP